ncbi:Histone transcription regulator 3 [Neofusicoccum ribis]|uniref:Histone transcription regulator 3 n=1 Tax=Neofusicoccum ribis TaxID=45134 RepID=A0ABR3TAV4_9PEZI
MLTLLEALHKQAVEEPERIYASCAISADIEEGFRDITVRQILSAIDAFAWWLQGGWGRSESFDNIAYVGPSDLRYAIFFYAAIKCGFKTLFVSPLNSLEASRSIVETTECLRIFYADPFAKVAKDLQSAAASRNLEVAQIASLDECLTAESTPYPYEKTFEEAKWDPIVIIHTSGTTDHATDGQPQGLLKPMTMNFGFFSTPMEPLPPVPGYKDGSFNVFNRRTFLGPFPPFHLGGVYTMMTIPAYCAATIVIPPPAAGPVSGDTLVKIMTKKKIEAMFSATLPIEQTMRTPGGADKLKEMEFISFAGAPLPPWCGDELSKHTTVKTFCKPLSPLASPRPNPSRPS